ncbi:MAG: alpha-1,4-glucan--maltose-1-phosphate maltosyltransferase [Solirubrobacteraceae bacterium]
MIQHPSPSVDGGRYPAKRCVGDTVQVSADVFRDGHDLIGAEILWRGPGESQWRYTPMRWIDARMGGVRWAGEIELDRPGHWCYTMQAWTDAFGTWRDELARKLTGGQMDLAGELSEGALLLEAAARRARAGAAEGDGDGDALALIEHAIAQLADQSVPESAKHDVVLGEELAHAMQRFAQRPDLVRIERPFAIEVDRLRARFGAWYELFPRSWGGLQGVTAQLPRLAELGFDVLYLTPIHPIGQTNRKGRDNALVAAPGDPGSPWAIGDATGGHDAIHAGLGTEDDLRTLTRAAAELGIDVALDLAIQCSADHPWLTEHPEWFHRRPDGTLKYAENPPKRYQDIYNVNWESPEWRSLWQALLDVVLHWVDHGIRVFRVDNPHTKPFAFWSWLIDEVHARDRDVIFLAEAFTRRALMQHLAKLGFNQSYTYFTWKNTRAELTEYLTELQSSGEQEYLRPNFFANTPDILHEYLQLGGRPAFEARLVLAATLSPSYGIYSGFEHCENVAAATGSEEYLHSEKYELKRRALDGPLLEAVAAINHARHAHPALQRLDNLTFLDTANEQLIAYLKRDGADVIICVVNLDPHNAQQGLVTIGPELGLANELPVRDLLTGERWQWRTGGNYVGLAPGVRQAHVLAVQRPEAERA